VGPHRVDQAGLAKIFPIAPGRLRDAVRVKHQRIAWGKLNFRNFDLPLFEKSQHGTGGMQPFHSRSCGSRTVAIRPTPQQQWRKVSAIHVAQSAAGVVVVTKEERDVTAVCGVLVEQTID
jgi:hypothetical protein